jgi:hypothetical protein
MLRPTGRGVARVHPRDRRPLARTRLRPGIERPAARQLHPVERCARRRDRLSDREEPGRDLRVASGPDRAAARRLPDELPLPVRRDGLRDVPHGTGVQRADRPARARRDGARAHVRAMARRRHGPGPGAYASPCCSVGLFPGGTRDAASRRHRGRGLRHGPLSRDEWLMRPSPLVASSWMATTHGSTTRSWR